MKELVRTDLVHRLRKGAASLRDHWAWRALCNEAADEIERIRADCAATSNSYLERALAAESRVVELESRHQYRQAIKDANNLTDKGELRSEDEPTRLAVGSLKRFMRSIGSPKQPTEALRALMSAHRQATKPQSEPLP